MTIHYLAIDAVQEVLVDPPKYRQEKTDKMNDQLNNLVPYFRCSDEDIVKVRGVNEIPTLFLTLPLVDSYYANTGTVRFF